METVNKLCKLQPLKLEQAMYIVSDLWKWQKKDVAIYAHINIYMDIAYLSALDFIVVGQRMHVAT